MRSDVSSPDDLSYWLRLEQIKGIGAQTARKLLATFGLPENIFSASHTALTQVVSSQIASAIKSPILQVDEDSIQHALAWESEADNHILTLADPRYPPSLLNIADPPYLLYAKGNTALLSAPSLAIVGSRHATTQGLRNAQAFSKTFSDAGLTVISGMALGIDTAAHNGGLAGTAATIAVIGTGADIVYPARNHALAHKIADKGCILSEYPLGTPALAANFPRRNRIISGLALGVLVVEAAEKSGSLITARMALEQDREVFAIPGSIHSPLSKGCHQLIKQGAKLVESAHDVLEELSFEAPSQPLKNVQADSLEAHTLLTALDFDPISIDAIVELVKLDPATLHGELLELELKGHIERLPNGHYQRLV